MNESQEMHDLQKSLKEIVSVPPLFYFRKSILNNTKASVLYVLTVTILAVIYVPSIYLIILLPFGALGIYFGFILDKNEKALHATLNNRLDQARDQIEKKSET